MNSGSIIRRGFATFVVLVLGGWIGSFLTVVNPIVTGNAAGRQFENSDTQYVVSQYLMSFVTGLSGWVSLAVLLVVIAIWWSPVKGFIKNAAVVVLLTGAALLASTSTSHAYYDKYDYTEAYFVLPNESAFFIPDVGANKDSQAKFGSLEYLAENKIAAKRFVIPHTKLENSGILSNFYVPAGRLIIVDRTPYYRQWVKDLSRGTGGTDEGIHCQSSEGLDITVGASIAASVLEENSPKFLFNFGVQPPKGDRSQPEVTFASVFQAYSLTQVMDGVVRSKVETLLCSEFTTRTFKKGNAEAATILASVETKVREYLDSVGIKLSYLGWSDTFSFDLSVQDAINRVFIAEMDQQIATNLAPHVATLQALAAANALRSFGEKTDGKLPRTIVNMPGDVGGLMGLLMSGHGTTGPKQ